MSNREFDASTNLWLIIIMFMLCWVAPGLVLVLLFIWGVKSIR